jgi:sulfide:quinone oxidoreductase
MSVSSGFRVLIAGGGVAALEAMLALRALAEERVDVELLAPEPDFVYRPLAVAEPFGAGNVERFNLTELTSEAGARFREGALAEVDADSRVARTEAGDDLTYDALLIACGAVPQPALPGAFTFRGTADVDAFRRILAEAASGDAQRLVFAMPGGSTWPVPLYELALQTATYLTRRGVSGANIEIVSHESAPMALFGPEASEAIARLLSDRDIRFRGRTYPGSVENGELKLVPHGSLPADRVISLPRLVGRVISGISQTAGGFIPVDPYGRVHGMSSVFAAGDATVFPVKHGGIAAQQAEAAAETIAALAGAPLTPKPFRPVLRGLVLTGGVPAYIRSELPQWGQASTFAEEPLWWPPGKIAGRYLAPFLASRQAVVAPELRPGPGVLEVSVHLSWEWSDVRD